MNRSKPTAVAQLVEERGLELGELSRPPKVLTNKNRKH